MRYVSNFEIYPDFVFSGLIMQLGMGIRLHFRQCSFRKKVTLWGINVKRDFSRNQIKTGQWLALRIHKMYGILIRPSELVKCNKYPILPRDSLMTTEVLDLIENWLGLITKVAFLRKNQWSTISLRNNSNCSSNIMLTFNDTVNI